MGKRRFNTFGKRAGKERWFMVRVSAKGIRFIQKFEGCRLVAYDDGTGVWTIGYGHTGPEVVPGLTWTWEQADTAFVSDLGRFEFGVKRALSRSATPGQFDAMVSLAYNIGLGAFRASTVLRLFNKGDLLGAAEAFIKFIKPVQVMEGLARRRAAEIVWFLS